MFTFRVRSAAFFANLPPFLAIVHVAKNLVKSSPQVTEIARDSERLKSIPR